MSTERVFTRPLVVFLALVGAVLLRAVNDRRASPDLEEAIAALRDGDLEGAERLALLRHVRATAIAAGDASRRLCAAAAAVALEDRAGFERATGDGGLVAAVARLGPGPERRAAALRDAGLGEPVLAALLAAAGLEAAGEAGAAADRYEQARASARLFELQLAGELAAAAVARLR